MADLFDYLLWRGDLSFAQVPPNAVDALIFSAISYIRFGADVESSPDTPILLSKAFEDLTSLPDFEDRIRVKKDLELLEAVSQSPRFGNCKIYQYRDILIREEETQFAAITFLLDDGSTFLAFRGTDYTLTGWKEDFNMSFQSSIPAQRLALEYVQEFAAAHPVPIWMGGHSKGGNLAVYAAAKCGETLQKRIVKVHNQDGPGFSEAMMDDPGYRNILPKLRSYVPQSSVIGMLLEHEEPYTIIKSNQIGIMQHDPYSWELEGPSFLKVAQITESSQFLDATIKNWFASMTNQERNRLVEVMYTLLTTGGVENAIDIFQPKNIRAYVKTLSSDADMRHILSTEFQGLLESAKKAHAYMEQQKALPPEREDKT